MKKRRHICLINGHPHHGAHFVTALADAYERGARSTGHRVDRIDVGQLEIVPLRDPAEFTTPAADPVIAEGQARLQAADHLVLLFPMWYGGLPAYTRSYLERLGQGGFFLQESAASGWPKAMMKGKSLRIVMTMGMPSLAYRLLFGAFGLRALEKSVFGISGFKPIRDTQIGMIGAMNDAARARWLTKLEAMGRDAR